MTVFDIIIALLLALALWRGFRQGFFVQLAGLAGLFIGAWLAIRFGHTVGSFFGISEKYAAAAGFLMILLLVLLLVAGIGRGFRKVFSFAGLGMLDKLAGMVLSLAKMGLILGLILWGFDSMNKPRGWVDKHELDKTVFYNPLVDVTVFVFPYIKSVEGFIPPFYRQDAPTDEMQNSGENG